MSVRKPWVILTSRWGADIRNPSVEQLTNAVREIFVEEFPPLRESDYAEHPSGWIRFGFDDGPMFVIDIGRNRAARFEQWADQDFERKLAPSMRLSLQSEADALKLWLLSVQGDVETIRKLNWQIAG